MKKVLFVATVTRHINAFHIPYLKWFKENGYEVHVASNGEESIEYCDKHYNIDFARSPFKIQNRQALKELKNIIKENKYEIIHSHTPVGGVLARIAIKKLRKKQEIRSIYTAHGFHFYKGASIINWLAFYPIERFLTKYTDDLITINQEDYELAKRKFKATKVHYVPGVGINLDKFNGEISRERKEQLYKELNLKAEDYIILYVAELNNNKNQTMIIQTVNDIIKNGEEVKVLLVGSGDLLEHYQNLINQLKLSDCIKLLGFRTDVSELMKITNLYISTSKREGLPVNIIEAMASSLPIIATKCRGNTDLIENGINGYIVEIGNNMDLKEKIIELKNNKEKAKQFAEKNLEISKKFEIDNIVKIMENIYLRKESK